MPPILSVIIPIFNEESTCRELIERVQQVPIEKEIIVVNDGSTDTTAAILSAIPGITILTHSANCGKGRAVQTALSEIAGRYVILQDGDLEYSPEDYLALLAEMKQDNCGAVFGSRWNHHDSDHTYHTIGNKVITWWANRLNKQKVTDMASCYKLIPAEILRELNLRSWGFGLEAEITAKLSRRGHTIREIPIQYRRRSVRDGKKLRLLDGLIAGWSCLRFRFFD